MRSGVCVPALPDSMAGGGGTPRLSRPAPVAGDLARTADAGKERHSDADDMT